MTTHPSINTATGSTAPDRSRSDIRRRPNIVYLHSHDTGREISPYGAAVHTPHLQSLAERGTTFRQAFAAAPTCSPSRAALLTGQSPHCSGMLGLAHRGHRLREPKRHLAAVLAAAGYTTALAGLQHLATDDDGVLAMGYQEVLGTADDADAAAAAFIERAPRAPYFLDVGFFETHRYGETVAFHRDGVHGDGRFAPAPPGLPDTPATRADYADFSHAVTRLDARIGRVVDALDRTGQLADTVVIVTTDHGIPFPQSKGNVNDRGLGVGLILAGLPELSGGRVVDDLVSQLDLFPTLSDLAGIPHPHWLEGGSLLPLLAGKPGVSREEVFGETTFHVVYEPVRTIRTPRFRYIRRFADQPHPETQNCDASLSKTALVDAGWLRTPLPEEELYDMALDPTGATNLIDDPALGTTLHDLRSRLHRWMIRTDDPLLHGPPPEPIRPPSPPTGTVPTLALPPQEKTP